MCAEDALLTRLVSSDRRRRTVFLAALAAVLLLAIIGFWAGRAKSDSHRALPVRGPHGVYLTKFPSNEFPISEGEFGLAGAQLVLIGLIWERSPGALMAWSPPQAMTIQRPY